MIPQPIDSTIKMVLHDPEGLSELCADFAYGVALIEVQHQRSALIFSERLESRAQGGLPGEELLHIVD